MLICIIVKILIVIHLKTENVCLFYNSLSHELLGNYFVVVVL